MIRRIPRKHVLVRTLLYLHHHLERASQDTEVALSQYLMLHFLLEEPRLAADFAAVSRFAQPSVTAVVQNLEKKGWIERVVDENDKRARFVTITDKGRQVLDNYESHLSDALADLLGKNAVRDANRDLTPLYELWNQKRIERVEKWKAKRAGKRKSRAAAAE